MAEITFTLRPGGREVEKNNYHTLDAHEGQVERRDVFDQGSKLNVQMFLTEIIHGTMDPSPSSSLATLIIADFQFISHDESRRFRHAEIEIRFRDINPSDSNPPEVLKIAPHLKYILNKTEKVQTLSRAAKIDAGASFVANITTGVEWNMSTTETKYSAAKVIGSCQMVDRIVEPKNAAKWSLSENKKDENGIPSLMRTAILLKRKNNAKFRCSIAVAAKVSWRKTITLESNATPESRTAGGDIDPVLFDPMNRRTTPIPSYIDATNLGDLELSNLMAIQSVLSIAPSQAVEVNTVTDLKTSGGSRNVVVPAAEILPMTVPAMATRVIVVEPALPSIPLSLPPEQPGLTENGEAKGSFILSSEAHVSKNIEQNRQADKRQSNTTARPTDILGALPHNLAATPANGSSLEETMKLLLHAVRKGVEVMAEANRIPLEPWPKSSDEE